MCDLKRDKRCSWSMYLAICSLILVGLIDYRVWGGLLHVDTFMPSLYLVVERLLRVLTLPILAAVAMLLLVRNNRTVDSEIQSSYN